MDAFGRARAVLDNHVNATLALADDVARAEVAQPDFVVWPENSSDVDPAVDPQAKAAISSAARGDRRARSSSASSARPRAAGT